LFLALVQERISEGDRGGHRIAHSQSVDAPVLKENVGLEASDVATSVVHGEEETTGQLGEPRCGAERLVQRAHQCGQVAWAVEAGERAGHDIANPLVTLRRPQSRCVQAGAEFDTDICGEPTQLYVAPRRQLDPPVAQRDGGITQGGDPRRGQKAPDQANTGESAVNGRSEPQHARAGVLPHADLVLRGGHARDATTGVCEACPAQTEVQLGSRARKPV